MKIIYLSKNVLHENYLFVKKFLHENYLFFKKKEFHINIQQIYEDQNLGYVKNQCMCILNSPSSVQSKHFYF